MGSQRQGQVTHASTATRGLATVALLKVNFDVGQDHLGMFEPFVLDAWAVIEDDGVTVDAVRELMIARHELRLPTNALRTLLSRLAHKGYATREGGRYFHTDLVPDIEDLAAARRRVEGRQKHLANALCAAASARGVAVGSTEDALALIMNFLERYHVSIALERPTGHDAALRPVDPRDEPDGSLKTVVTAGFLNDTIQAGGELAGVVQEMLEGYVLQNALLLKDISHAARRFRNLHVVCDSMVLFGALGLRGGATETATKELFALLRDSGCVLDVFEQTIREMRRILAVYEHRLGSHAGRMGLYQTDLTRYFITNRFSPSDVRTVASLIEKNLKGLGLNIRETPARKAALTLDEGDLAAKLANERSDENAPRVLHDIDCIAGVITYRGGVTTDTLDNARAVFLTTSSLTAQTIRDWYREQGGRGFPPIIHYLLLSNIAWLKRPATASRLKVHELVALCTAALRPSRQAWEKFLRHLRSLEQSGVLSSDEVTAIVASDLTDRALVEEEVGEDSDAATLTEVVERVQAVYREEANEIAGTAQEAARKSEAATLEIRQHVQNLARKVAQWTCWAIAVLLGAVCLAATILTLIDTARGSRPGWVTLVTAGVLAVAGLLSLFWGFYINRFRTQLEDWLTARLIKVIGGRSATS